MQYKSFWRLLLLTLLSFASTVTLVKANGTDSSRAEFFYSITGPSTITAGSEDVTYTVSPSLPAGYTWALSGCGFIDGSSSTTCYLTVLSSSCTSTTLRIVNGSTIITSKVITVVPPQPLAGGTINNPNLQVITGTAPAQITATVATGGTGCTSYSYQWQSSTNGTTFTNISGATGQNYQPPALTANTYYKRMVTCGTGTAYTSNTAYVQVYPPLIGGTVSPSSYTINYNTAPPGSFTCTAASGGTGSYSYQWLYSTDGTNFTSIPSNIGTGAQSQTYQPPVLTTTTYYRCQAISTPFTANSTNTVVVTVYPQLLPGSITPAAITINQGTSPGQLTGSLPSGGNGIYLYQWKYSIDNGVTWLDAPGDASGVSTNQNYTPGNLWNNVLFKRVVTSNLVPATSNIVAVTVTTLYGVTSPTNASGNPNTDMNWIITQEFDAGGNVLHEGKGFYDDNGHLIQSQKKVNYRADASTVYTHVLASQPIKDAFGRDALTTLWAPIDYGDYSYQANFVRHNSAGDKYGRQNFDVYNPSGTQTDKTNNPDPLWDAADATMPPRGSLAWYYSKYNSWEPYTPTTDYPYVRQTYYQDGTGNTKKAANTGEVFKLGSSREAANYTIPVIDELDNYILVRNRFFSTTEIGVLPSNLLNHAIQYVSRDANGIETIRIDDQSGKTLMTARAGTGLTVSNTATVTAAGTAKSSLFYFKLFAGSTVTITGGSFTLYDMNTEQSVAFSSGNTLAGGYYKLVNTGTTDLSLAYSNSYSDVSYNFYNQLGQMVASISPEGTKKLYGAPGLNAYASKTTVPFITLLQYDNRGKLIMSTDPDRGISRFLYRNDGKLRFSQNAVQAAAGSFNYINYDQLGRIVESGQYLPGTGGIAFGSASMTGILENTGAGGGLTGANNTRTDVCTTLYDLPDINLTLSGYVQDPYNLTGSVSMTQKYSSILNNVLSSSNLVSTTWYNYDEEGKIIWMVRNINGLGYKTSDYSYDAFGRLTRKVFQAGTSSEAFAQYYDYDPVNGNLWHVYTSTTPDNNKQLQATYIYYMHGGLKRVELAGNLQGIDYTYTLQGALKAINNSKRSADPGSDGISNSFSQDAFGEVLDYFPGDYSNSRSNINAITGISAPTVPNSYTGNIKAMTWYSEKPFSSGVSDAPTTYVYQYDPKYQFTESTWGTNINFGTNPATYTATSNNKERIGDPANNVPAYDDNGNIQYLQRTDAAGASIAQFRYHYDNSNNQLTSIVNSATSQNYATFNYDQVGEVTGEVTTDGLPKYIVYDIAGMPTAVYRDQPHAQPVATFVYDELGRRIKKVSYNPSGQVINVTYYVDDVIYTQEVTNNGTVYGTIAPQEYQITGMGRLGIYYPKGVYAYELDDHLGNVRAVVARNANTCEVRMYTDYYPYGMVIGAPSGTNDYRYGYQGQNAEKDGETGWNAFELRMYDGVIARWLQYDPSGQFHSPYVAMGNDPVSSRDPDGGTTDDYFRNARGQTFWDPSKDAEMCFEGETWTNIGESYDVYEGIFRVGTWGAGGKYTPVETPSLPYQGTISNYKPTHWQTLKNSGFLNRIMYDIYNSVYVTAQNLGGKQLAGRTYAFNLDGSVTTPRENVDAFATTGTFFVPMGEGTSVVAKGAEGAQQAGIRGIYILEYTLKGVKKEYVGKSVDVMRRIYQHILRIQAKGGTLDLVKDIIEAAGTSDSGLRQLEQMVIDGKGGVGGGNLWNERNAFRW